MLPESPERVLFVLVPITAIASDPSEVVVVSAPAVDPSTAIGTVTVLLVDADLPASADVASLVDTAPGTTVRHLGGLGDFTAVSIRGSTLRQVQVHLDGVPLNPDGASVVNLAELPLRAFSRVEVWRGNAPPELGAAPIGGVINLVTGEEPTSSAALAVGTLGTSRLDGSLALSGKADALLFGELFATAGDFRYFDDNATLYTEADDAVRVRGNDDKRQASLLARVRWGDEHLRFTLLDSLVSREEGLPGHVYRPSSHVRLETARNLASFQVDLGDRYRTTLRTWAQHRDEILDDRLGEIGVASQLSRGRSSTYGIHASARRVGEVAPALTFDARADRFRATDLWRDDPGVARLRLAGTAAASVAIATRRFSATPVLAAEVLDDRQLGPAPPDGLRADPSKAPAVWASPRLGVAVRPVDALSLRADVGRYLRPPDLLELFGDRGAIRGNAALAPERGTQWDVGARWVSPDDRVAELTLDAGYFWNASHDLIVWVQNAQRVLYPVNIGKAWVQGLEAAAEVHVGPVASSTSLTRTVSVNLVPTAAYANNRLPRLPALDVEQETALAFEHVRFGHSFSYTAGNYWDATNWYLSAPRPLHAVFVRVEPRPGLTVEADILNLVDRIVEEVPRNPLDAADPARIDQPITDFAGWPLPGRTLLVSLRFQP